MKKLVENGKFDVEKFGLIVGRLDARDSTFKESNISLKEYKPKQITRELNDQDQAYVLVLIGRNSYIEITKDQLDLMISLFKK